MNKNKKWLCEKNKGFFCLIIFILTQLLIGPGYAWDEGVQIREHTLAPMPYQYTLAADKWMTSRAGADLSLSLIELYRNIENSIFKVKDTNALMYILKIPLRYIAAAEVVLIQHEVFGHGSRARELGVEVTDYEIGFLQGATFLKYDPTLSLQKHIVIDLGGISGTHVLGERIKQSFFAEDGVINPVRGIGYILSQTDQIAYSFSEYKGSGHDIKNYMDKMNKIYGANFLTKEKIKTAALISAIDPFLFFSLYSFIVDQDVAIPMFKIGEFNYLPALRSIFTPYGIETKLLNNFTKNNIYGQVNLSYGNNKTSNSYSIETNVYNLWWVNNLSLWYGVGCMAPTGTFFS